MTKMGFNLNGLFRYYYIDNEGNDYTKGFSRPAQFISSYSSMVENRESYFNIEALEDCYILEFSYIKWKKMIESDLRWYPAVNRLIEVIYIMKEKREKAFLLDDATTRYLEFKKNYSDIEDKIKLYHTASFLGITPEALSRIRKKLKN